MKRLEIMPGDRVMMFDNTLWIDDKKTPLSHTVRPATIIRRYGKRDPKFGIYPDLIDVRFDHRPDKISKGHFISCIYPDCPLPDATINPTDIDSKLIDADAQEEGDDT